MMLWMMVLGIAGGMRCMTPMAVLCWFMWFAMFPVTRLTFWTANWIAVLVFTVFAFGEFYGDTLPQTPNRTDAFPLISRIVFGALVGAILASVHNEPIVGGMIFVTIGTLIGAYGGVRLRLKLAKVVGDDFPVAIGESALAVGLSVLAMAMLYRELLWEWKNA